MVLYRAFIDNKKVVNRVYWAGSDDDETVKVKKQVTDVFTDETFPFPVNVWGVDMDNNIITFHQCSCDSDYKDSSKLQNSILILFVLKLPLIIHTNITTNVLETL